MRLVRFDFRRGMRGHAERKLFFKLHGRSMFGGHVQQPDTDDMLLFDGSSLGFTVSAVPGVEHK